MMNDNTEPIVNAINAVIKIFFIESFFIIPQIIPTNNKRGNINVESEPNKVVASIIKIVNGIVLPEKISFIFILINPPIKKIE